MFEMQTFRITWEFFYEIFPGNYILRSNSYGYAIEIRDVSVLVYLLSVYGIHDDLFCKVPFERLVT
jgi:hypothetical protein